MAHPDLELIRRHVAALFVHDAVGRLVCGNDIEGRPAPRFYLGRTAAGNLCRVRCDLEPALAAQLEALAADEPVGGDPEALPRHHEAYRALLAPADRVWSGPAFAFVGAVAPNASTQVVTPAGLDVLRGGALEDWIGDVGRCDPVVARPVEGKAGAVCASVRITAAAHEAGVETAPEHRGRGYAGQVVQSWAAAVQRTGALALYSTSWDNHASRRVAAKLGLARYGSDYHLA